VLAEIIRTGRVRATAAIRMEENLTSFEDCLGGCERILKTPIPLSYTRCVNGHLAPDAAPAPRPC
jgi:predicted membrane chloride channel (bestrophin family)